jgi:septal ring factor EnvC (AmiA/AmiB activator)
MEKPVSLLELRRSSRRTAIASLLSGLIVLGSLAFSGYRLHSLRQEMQVLEGQLKDKKSQIDQLDAQIRQKEAQLRAINTAFFLAGSSDSQSAQQTNQALHDTLDANPSLATLLPRVYFHVRTKEQSARAKPLADALIAAGFSVPGMIIVGNKAPHETQLRYFERTDQAEKDRAHIHEVLSKLNINADEVYIAPSADLGPMRPRHFELWFGPSF